MASCPDCGASLAEDFHFCPTCGIPLVAAPPRRVGEHLLRSTRREPAYVEPAVKEVDHRPGRAERRQVSVLFIDMVGFTSLTERLDPEDVREIQSRYFESARSTVSHYGGSLEKFIGDAVMAVWGTPVARENDGERAVRAALEMVRNVGAMRVGGGETLSARAAVTTGEAAVSFDTTGEGMVTGDLVNTASRLQGAAEAGTVLVDEATRRAVGDALGFEAAGQRSLKGKAAEVSAWRAVGEPHVDGVGPAGHAGKMVGRTVELRSLHDHLQSAIDERRLKVTSIIGVAGIGKSRLAWEMQRTTDREAVRWLAGRPPRWGETRAYAPLSEVLRHELGVSEREPMEVVRRALAESLQRLVTDEGERTWMEPRIIALLEPSSTIRTEREELFAAWRRYLEALAESAPLVLLFEDLQWADVETLDFIDYLARWSRGRPILLLCLARPELLESRQTWGAGMPNFTSMHLDRLADSEVEELIAQLAPGLEPELAARIRQRAEGVPLYAVEMARMLGDDDAGPSETVELPESLHALVAARIDALPAAERSLLLGAAVLGRRFRPEALAAISGLDKAMLGERVAALLRREFLAMDDEPGSPGRGQLSFVQDLVREVAYNTLSRRERRARHLAVIDYLEAAQDPDLIEPVAEHLVAAHASVRADQPEADVIAGRARVALRLAADRATALHAPARALAHLQQALSLTADAGARADLTEAAAMAARAAARFGEAEAYLREAIDLRDAAEDAAGSTRHRAQLASLLLQAQRSETALAELESAWNEADGEAGASDLRLPAELARAYLLRGETDRAIEWSNRAIEYAARDGSTDAADSSLAIDPRITLGTALAQAGRPREGLAELQRAIDEASAAGISSVELRARANLAWLTISDEPSQTSAIARRGLEVAQELGIREWSLHLLDIATVVAVDLGEWDWALAALDDAGDGELPTGYRLDFAATRTMIRALRGDADALDPVERLGVLEADLDPQALGWVDIAQALGAICGGELGSALVLAQAAARKTVGWERAEALALAGRLAAWSGDRAATRAALDELAAEPSWGNAAEARLLALRAAHEALSRSDATRTRAARRAEKALTAWRDLGVPVKEAFSQLDRWILLGDEEARDAAKQLIAELGATSLVQLLSRPTSG